MSHVTMTSTLHARNHLRFSNVNWHEARYVTNEQQPTSRLKSKLTSLSISFMLPLPQLNQSHHNFDKLRDRSCRLSIAGRGQQPPKSHPSSPLCRKPVFVPCITYKGTSNIVHKTGQLITVQCSCSKQNTRAKKDRIWVVKRGSKYGIRYGSFLILQNYRAKTGNKATASFFHECLLYF
jgi:hypothetical protein